MRQLSIICDGPKCPESMTTGVSDAAPVQIDAPGDWLTLHKSGHPDRHFCSLACLGAFAVPSHTTTPPAVGEHPPAKKGKTHDVSTQ